MPSDAQAFIQEQKGEEIDGMFPDPHRHHQLHHDDFCELCDRRTLAKMSQPTAQLTWTSHHRAGSRWYQLPRSPVAGRPESPVHQLGMSSCLRARELRMEM